MNYGKLNIGTFLKQAALNWPDQEAIVDGEKRFSWREFNERVNGLAHALLDLGIKKGDRVSYLFFNQWESLCCYFAIVKIGALVVPLNFRLVGREIKYQLQNSGAKILIFGQSFMDLVHTLQPDLPGITHYICAGDRVPGHLLPFDSFIEKYSPKRTEISLGSYRRRSRRHPLHLGNHRTPQRGRYPALLGNLGCGRQNYIGGTLQFHRQVSRCPAHVSPGDSGKYSFRGDDGRLCAGDHALL